jgi:hypothetical protein
MRLGLTAQQSGECNSQVVRFTSSDSRARVHTRRKNLEIEMVTCEVNQHTSSLLFKLDPASGGTHDHGSRGPSISRYIAG